MVVMGASLGVATEAWSADEPPRRAVGPGDGLSVGAGVSDADPGYVGYHSRVTPVPLFSYQYSSFFVSGLTAGYVAIDKDGFAVSLLLVPQMMRVHSSDSPQLAGLRSREWSIDGGLNMSLKRSWGILSFSTLQDVLGRNKGTQVGLRYAYPIDLGGGVLTPGTGLTWESANMTRYYYGISEAEALPNRPEYSPGSALNPSVGLNYAHPIGVRWRLSTGVTYTHFDRAIQQSPIIDKSNVMGVAIALTYSFGRPRQKVPSDTISGGLTR